MACTGILNTTEVHYLPSPSPSTDEEDIWLKYFGTEDTLVDCGCQTGTELISYKTVMDSNIIMLIHISISNQLFFKVCTLFHL